MYYFPRDSFDKEHEKRVQIGADRIEQYDGDTRSNYA